MHHAFVINLSVHPRTSISGMIFGRVADGTEGGEKPGGSIAGSMVMVLPLIRDLARANARWLRLPCGLSSSAPGSLRHFFQASTVRGALGDFAVR
jgi:hypothetical protein